MQREIDLEEDAGNRTLLQCINVIMTCAQKKEMQLGFKIGTAQARLRRQIMFWLICKAGLATCYRCHGPLTEETFSIDHKQPWLDEKTTALFWDLDNIAVSHKKCNFADRRTCLDRTAMKKILTMNKGPAGTLWCGGHRDYLPKELFSKNKSRWSGHQDQCRECRSKKRSGGG